MKNEMKHTKPDDTILLQRRFGVSPKQAQKIVATETRVEELTVSNYVEKKMAQTTPTPNIAVRHILKLGERMELLKAKMRVIQSELDLIQKTLDIVEEK